MTSAPIEAYLYDSEGRDRLVTLESLERAELGEHSLLWVDLAGIEPDKLERVAAIFDLDPRSLWAIRRDTPLLRVENYGAYNQFSVLLPPLAPRDEGRRHRLDFLVGDNWVVTVRDTEIGYLREFRDQDKGETRTGELTAAVFAAGLLDWHLESFFREVSEVGLEIDRLEDRIFRESHSEALPRKILHVLRRISRLRATLADLRPVFYGLVRPDVIASSNGGSAELAERLTTRYERALDEIERSRELVIGSFDLLNSRLGQRTNDLVKALTFVTVIIGGAAAVAGIFGMNFDPPFFQSGTKGFFAVTGSMIAFALIAYGWAKWKRYF